MFDFVCMYSGFAGTSENGLAWTLDPGSGYVHSGAARTISSSSDVLIAEVQS
jgi:hypothetical protein